MRFVELLQISTLVLASLGGGGAIVFGLSRFLGQKWLQDWKGEIDEKLQRLDSALQHRNFVRQRLSEFELEAITDCWRSARACLPLINATRPVDSGVDEAVLSRNAEALSKGHNLLIESVGRHELFLPSEIVKTLDALGRVIRLELSNIRHHEHFKDPWWEEGEKNRSEFAQLCDLLLALARVRVGVLRAEMVAESTSPSSNTAP